MGKFTITENGKIQYDYGRGLKFISVLGLDDRYFLHHDEKFIIAEERFNVILCKRIRPRKEEKRSDQDFYDENNKANLLEKEMIESYDSSIKDFFLVIGGIIAVYVFSNVLNTLINLF